MIEQDLRDDDVEWIGFAPAGADQKAELVMLYQSADATRRAVLVRFPAGWERTITGHQPAGEEMVVLSGALAMSGRTCTPGTMLVVTPRATRSATATPEETRAVVWFSGAAGGWSPTESDEPGEVSLRPLEPGVVRPATPGLSGSVEVVDGSTLTTFEVEVDLISPGEGRWFHLAAGERAPGLAGDVVVRRWD
ncbi:hypothetical protein CLV56_0586 [Mumia flava]|uniref:Cupin domain-containing protein n=1 Tax=Mumia flava TaxID=1348852 RepID=A0A0B2BGU1_9ACTN|nr:hypothetical protein [Mumia flava]PJJ56380.1 hypothetical protein CLV56_0586 [Mumia flava]